MEVLKRNNIYFPPGSSTKKKKNIVWETIIQMRVHRP